MKPRTLRFLPTCALLLAPAASLLVSSTAFAGNLWDGGGTAVAGLFNWSDSNNWDSNTPPAYGTLLTFGGSTGLTSNNNGATTSVAGITFSSGAGAFTLSGSNVTLGGNITNSSSSLQTVNLPLVLNDNRTVTLTSGDITLGGAISGGFNLVVSGGTARTVTMNTAGSSYSRLQINSATTKLGVNNALPTSGGVLFASGVNGGTLDLNGKTQTLGSTIVFGGSAAAGTAIISDSLGGGLLKLGGDVTQNATTGSPTVNISAALDLNGATRTFNANNTSGIITISGAISNSTGTAGLTKGGGGTLTLTGGLANTFNGAININGGRLNVLDGLSLTNTVGIITVASGAAFNYSKNFANGNNLSNALNLSGAGDGTIGALNLQGNVVVTGGITLAADATITHDFNNATIQTGAITGSGRNLQLTTTVAGQAGLVISSAIQTGAGRVSVTGAANSGDYSVRLGGDNTFTGGLVINNGVVQLNSVGALNSTAGSENAVTFGASTTTGKLALNGRSYTISNLTSNATPGSPVVENGNATAVTLTVGNSQNLSGTYAGAIQDGTGGGALSLSKAGTGALTLSGTNTYTGATNVNQGALIVGVAGVGSTAAGSAVTVAAGTATDTPVARLGGTGTIGGTVSLAAESTTGFKNGGVLTPTAAVSGSRLSVTGTTTFGAGSIFEWNMSAVNPAEDPVVDTNSGSYGQLAGTGAITGSDAVFKIVLGAGNAFTDAFWNSDKTWDNVFTGLGATVDLTSIFSSFGGSGGISNTGEVSGRGQFSFTSASTLTWTAVPEPTSALAGVLLTAGLLRRRRR